ncbi:MAG: radical SAM protein [Candidatus Binatia bacterium]|nr:MAG: radical SAM protein [Candidatus Binatia bacterium]
MASPPRGRGTGANPENRYERIHVELEETEFGERVPTVYYRDASRSALAENESPDVGFRWSLNPYRGCEHGCIYCYARPTHEYLGFSAGLDFETRIFVKEEAPELLRAHFLSEKWRPETVALSGNTDCYQPGERYFRLTRRCLEVFAEFRNPVAIVTKSALVLRDLDLLEELARYRAVAVFVSLTTLRDDLAGKLEPRAARPGRRLETISALARAGVPVGVMVAPVIPGLNDEEIPRILSSAAAAGAASASWVLLRLPKPVDRLFLDWVDRCFPERRRRVEGRIRECRGGRLSDARFGTRMRGEGPYAAQLASLFRVSARRYGLDRPLPALDPSSFRIPPEGQLSLF